MIIYTITCEGAAEGPLTPVTPGPGPQRDCGAGGVGKLQLS